MPTSKHTPLQKSPLPQRSFLHTYTCYPHRHLSKQTIPHAHSPSFPQNTQTKTNPGCHHRYHIKTKVWYAGSSPITIQRDSLEANLTWYTLSTRDKLFHISPWKFKHPDPLFSNSIWQPPPQRGQSPEVWGTHSLQIGLGSSPRPGSTGLLRRWSPATGALRSQRSPGRKGPTTLQFPFRLQGEALKFWFWMQESWWTQGV